jgi:hypothetical protein
VTTPKRTRGTDPWLTIGRTRFLVWDRWFLALLFADHDGAWDALRNAVRSRPRVSGSDGRDTEAKLSHLVDLQDRWTRLRDASRERLKIDTTDRGLVRRARSKLLDQSVEDYEKTPGMRDTPRLRLERRARRGYWDRFPVNPTTYEPVFDRAIESREFFTEMAALRLASRLESILDRQARRATRPVQHLALTRAFLAAVVAAIERADDSCGALGDLAHDRFPDYFKSDWQAAGLPPDVFYRDVLEFAVWDDYGLVPRPLTPFFKRVTKEHVLRVDGILREIRAELLAADLDYEAEKALTLRGELHVAKRRFEGFVALAEEMGSRERERIRTMAEAALQAGRRDLAVAVFAAADQPGVQRDQLREQSHRLLGKRVPARSQRPTLVRAR